MVRVKVEEQEEKGRYMNYLSGILTVINMLLFISAVPSTFPSLRTFSHPLMVITVSAVALLGPP